MSLLNGLVSYYNGSYTGTVTVTDVHGSNNGTASNARVVNATSKIGKGFDFTQGSDYIDLGSKFNFGARSFSFWIKTSQASDGIILDNARRSSTNIGSTFSVNTSTSGKLNWYIFRGTSGSFGLVTTSTSVNTNSWVHIVGTYDGTANANGIKLYINGVLDVQGTAPASISGTSTDVLRFGIQSQLTGAPYNGFVDETGIWNRALSANEISTLHEIQRGGSPSGSYPFSLTGVFLGGGI